MPSALRKAAKQFIEHLFDEVVLPSAPPLDLNEVRGREDRPHHCEVQNVGAVVAGCHHANRHTDTGAAGAVVFDEVTVAAKVVVGEVHRHLLSVRDVARDLHREVRPVSTGPQLVRHFIQDLNYFSCMVLTNREGNRLSELTGDGIAQAMLQKRLAEGAVGRLGEEALLEVSSSEGVFDLVAFGVRCSNDEALVRE